ncbi:putative phosphotransacetylase [Caldalkalibacillus uzonensis]|uniref:Phosphate propanoyltransferase n=1 Tax=Caldalkalibacillus uzonensis TaxID=353224 RepID=A0ABU0CRF3_9BACI|nr:phosphate propanoyltransferase [Caldalkalibacillus uzonensis]MDQ0338727.1 putative phosphotransacetylase [Caldalkalibacillus uzonensis]
MDQTNVQSLVEQVLSEYHHGGRNGLTIPIAVSARHVHLSQAHVEALFGAGYQLTHKADLSQPGQFAAEETVIIAGPKGCLERVRILGPARGESQVEISRTDAFKLGLNPPLRLSGDIKGSSPVTVIGPKGSVHLSQGLIIAQNHIHMTPEDAAAFNVEHGQCVKVKVKSERPITFENVLIRVSDRYKLEMHIDTDEGNAALISTRGEGILIPSHTPGVIHS